MPKNKTKTPATQHEAEEPPNWAAPDDIAAGAEGTALARVDAASVEIDALQDGIDSIATELGLGAGSGIDSIRHTMEKLSGRDIEAEGGANVVPTGMTLAQSIMADRKRMQEMEAELRAARITLDRVRQALASDSPGHDAIVERANHYGAFHHELRRAAVRAAAAGDLHAFGIVTDMLVKLVGEAKYKQLMADVKVAVRTAPAGVTDGQRLQHVEMMLGDAVEAIRRAATAASDAFGAVGSLARSKSGGPNG
jgi:hypothetical protein